MLEDRLDRVAAAVDEINHARRDRLDLVDQLDDPGRGPRIALGGLEDEGVAAGDRVGQEPERDHRREVERGDRGDDADRLADHLDVETGGHSLERFALDQVGNRRRRFDRFDSAAHLPAGVGERLSHVGGDQGRRAPRDWRRARRGGRAPPGRDPGATPRASPAGPRGRWLTARSTSSRPDSGT